MDILICSVRSQNASQHGKHITPRCLVLVMNILPQDIVDLSIYALTGTHT